MNISTNRFALFFGGSWSSFLLFAILTYAFDLYTHVPFLGPVAYATMILLLLVALSASKKRRHYLLVSGSLMLYGAMASFDLISSKSELTEIWQDWLHLELSGAQADGLVQMLSILISIFCGSLASATLFYGLNPKNFPPRDAA